jgi:hypothetical protein
MDEGFSFVHYGCHPCMLKNVINPLWIDDTTNFMNVIQNIHEPIGDFSIHKGCMLFENV